MLRAARHHLCAGCFRSMIEGVRELSGVEGDASAGARVSTRSSPAGSSGRLSAGTPVPLTGSTMRCSTCGFDNPERMKFSGQCTTPLALMCANCYFENLPASSSAVNAQPRLLLDRASPSRRYCRLLFPSWIGRTPSTASARRSRRCSPISRVRWN